MIFKFEQIPSLENMSFLIEKSKGNVYLQRFGERYVDMKKSEAAREELRDEMLECKSITLHVFDLEDCLKFVNYMVNANM